MTEIAGGVSHLLAIDWSVITCCDRDWAKVMASSIDLGTTEQIVSLHRTLTQTVVNTGQCLCVREILRNRSYGLAPEGYRSYLGIPLSTPGGKTIGTVCCFGKQPREFTAEELKTAELFAERAAIAIDNYNLDRQQQDFNQALEIQVAKRTAELKATQAKLIEQEKLAAIGQFASTIVHEIRNPTTTILMGLNALSKLELSQRDRLRLSLALEEGDRDKFKQVMINLVKNACEAVSSGEVVTCSISQDSSSVRISVHNGGTPIPPAMLPKLTEPFVSQKSDGTGLGLAIVKQIVTAHQGTLLIQSTAETGTTISFTLPLINFRAKG